MLMFEPVLLASALRRTPACVALVGVMLAGCAGAPQLNPGIETGVVRAAEPTVGAPRVQAVPTKGATGSAAAPTAPQLPETARLPDQASALPSQPAVAAPASASVLQALNPLPVLGQLATSLGSVAPPTTTADAPSVQLAQGVAPGRTAETRMTEERTVSGKPMELYERIARRVHGCFMGGRGPLAGTHLFQGDAKPETRGGTAEITVHEKDKSLQFPRGLMVLRIGIEPGAGETTKVDVTTIRLANDLALAMRADVLAWAQGRTDACQAQVVRPPAPIPVAAAPAKAKKKKAPTVRKPVPVPSATKS